MGTGDPTNDLAAALDGDAAAWSRLVDRHAGLVWSVVRSFRMDESSREDAFQTTWLRLLDRGHTIEDPRRLPAWLATVARRECLALLRLRTRTIAVDEGLDTLLEPASLGSRVESDELQLVVRGAFEELDERCRMLLSLLMSDPPMPYATVSTVMEIPVGGIGPTRERCLEKLRRRPAIARITTAERASE